MWRSFVGTSLFLLVAISHSFCCWCVPGSTSNHVEATSIVFVGRAVFNDDDGSGKFTQKTLVRFEVEEAYKGLEQQPHDVWVDPGSFTSCYATYRVGDRYLVFGYKRATSPRDTLSVSVARGQSNAKPVPPRFDLQNPPKVYWAPECAGTRQVTPQADKDISYLRKYKERAREKTTVQP